MSGSSLLLIVDAEAARDREAAAAERVLRCWPADHRPSIRVEHVHQVMEEPARMDGAGAVWLKLERTGSSSLFELAGLIQERHLPAMLMQAGDHSPAGTPYEQGITHCPPSTPTSMVCAVLRTLWNQSATLDDLREELRVLQAHQGGLAGQINQMDEELRLAAQLQREFLPGELPKVPGLECEVFWRPAGYVSGDIYDLIKLDENHVGFFLADAVGHGVPAALMTMYIKRSLHTKHVDPSLPAGYRLYAPNETLGQLNHDMIQRQTDQVRFATACYGVIDCRTRKVCLARAGHPAPALLRADGRTEWIEPDGGLLGVFPDEQFEQVCFDLNPDDRLLLYSDGFEVAFPDAEADANKVANDRYCEEFEALRIGRIDEAIHKFESRLDEQAGSLNQRDDLTVLCLGGTHEPLIDEAPLEQRDTTGKRLRKRLAAPSPVA